MAMDLVLSIATTIGGYLVAHVSRQFGYLIFYDGNIKKYGNGVTRVDGNARRCWFVVQWFELRQRSGVVEGGATPTIIRTVEGSGGVVDGARHQGGRLAQRWRHWVRRRSGGYAMEVRRGASTVVTRKRGGGGVGLRRHGYRRELEVRRRGGDGGAPVRGVETKPKAGVALSIRNRGSQNPFLPLQLTSK
ncbi:hypothetical protein U1Q18_023069 [Sarracenia purpurea var. burkii]